MRNSPLMRPGPEARYAELSQDLVGLYLRRVILDDHAGFKTAIERLERDIVMFALERTNGNQKEAARILCLKPTTLHYKMRHLGITPVRRFDTEATLRSD